MLLADLAVGRPSRGNERGSDQATTGISLCGDYVTLPQRPARRPAGSVDPLAGGWAAADDLR